MSNYGKGVRMKKNQWGIIILSVLCILSICLMIYALIISTSNESNTEFVPPGFEENAVEGVPDVPDVFGWSEIYQEGMNFRVGISKKIIVDSENQADVYLYNSKENNVWLKLRLFDEDGNILSESGLIKSGEYVKTIMFYKPVLNGQKVKLKIMSYQPETYYSEGSIILNTEIQREG